MPEGKKENPAHPLPHPQIHLFRLDPGDGQAPPSPPSGSQRRPAPTFSLAGSRRRPAPTFFPAPPRPHLRAPRRPHLPAKHRPTPPKRRPPPTPPGQAPPRHRPAHRRGPPPPLPPWPFDAITAGRSTPPPHAVLLDKERDRWPLEARLICAAHDGSVRKIKKIAKELDVHGHGIPATVASTTYMGMNALDISPSRITATIFTKRCTAVQVEHIQQSKPHPAPPPASRHPAPSSTAHLLCLHPRGPPLQVHVGAPSSAAERMTRDTSPCWSAPPQLAVNEASGPGASAAEYKCLQFAH